MVAKSARRWKLGQVLYASLHPNVAYNAKEKATRLVHAYMLRLVIVCDGCLSRSVHF